MYRILRLLCPIALIAFSSSTLHAAAHWPTAREALAQRAGLQVDPDYLDEIIHQLLTADYPQQDAAIIKMLFAAGQQLLQKRQAIGTVFVPRDKDAFFVGNLSGDLVTLRNLMCKKDGGLYAALQQGHHVVFLGNYVDGGWHSCEVLALVIALALRYPEQVTVLRGSQECAADAQRSEFVKEMEEKYWEKNKINGIPVVGLYGYALSLFRSMPLGTMIFVHGHKYFAVHAGVPFLKKKEEYVAEDLFEHWKFKRARPLHTIGLGAASALMRGFLLSRPGDKNGLALEAGIPQWGADLSEAFCEHYSLRAIIRSHDNPEWGYQVQHKQRVYTVSAQAPAVKNKGKGACLKISKAGLSFNEW
jgi:hypothetical protein